MVWYLANQWEALTICPQINRRYTGDDISNYFDSVKFFTTYKGSKISVAPKLLRVDNVDFNKKLVDKILEKA